MVPSSSLSLIISSADAIKINQAEWCFNTLKLIITQNFQLRAVLKLPLEAPRRNYTNLKFTPARFLHLRAPKRGEFAFSAQVLHLIIFYIKLQLSLLLQATSTKIF